MVEHDITSQNSYDCWQPFEITTLFSDDNCQLKAAEGRKYSWSWNLIQSRSNTISWNSHVFSGK